LAFGSISAQRGNRGQPVASQNLIRTNSLVVSNAWR
jgi:hypothetical protein